MKRPALIVVAMLCSCVLWADLQFAGLDLSPGDELLFTASAAAPPFGRYETLFLADLSGQTMRQLTVFPERITFLPHSGQLQYQNRFGVFRTNTALEAPQPVDGFPAFIHGRTSDSGKTMPIEASPDGRYLVYTEATGIAHGDLMLYDTQNNRSRVIVERIELSLSGPPVVWSPDSSLFVYRKAGGLSIFSVTRDAEGRQLGEELRRIGPGGISSVRWSETGDLFYVRGSMVYRIAPSEFFVRAFYQDLARTGTIVGKIPFAFDPNFDSFWISPDSRSLLLNKGGNNLFLYLLSAEDFGTDLGVLQLPYVRLPRSARVQRVLWSRANVITLLISSIESGRPTRSVFRMVPEGRLEFRLERLSAGEAVRDAVLSPDGSRAAVLLDRGVSVVDYRSWQPQRFIAHVDPLHAVWTGDETVVVAGRTITERVALRTGSARVIALSQVERYGFSEDDGSIVVDAHQMTFRFDRDEHRFMPTTPVTRRAASTASRRFRVFLETLRSGSYQNIVMVRDIVGVRTSSLFLPPQRTYEPFPAEDEPVSFTVFNHGSRIRRRELAFAINAIDSVEGLSDILKTLADYSIRTTFFVNGDFMRRHPDAVREIALAGHEVGSLFFTYFDMTDARFDVNAEFIKRGLAQTEDQFFETTGSELSLIWHTPFYFVSPPILQASRELGYTFVGRDVDSLDWVPRRDDSGLSRLYLPTAQIIERVVEESRPGSIISMTVGVPLEGESFGGRDDYLFQHLDLLINRLMERGYSVVPVSELMDRAR